MNRKPRALFLLAALVAVLLVLGGCRRHKHDDLDLSESAEPDKILFEKSLEDIENKRYAVARLTLQTMLNAYPDSEYLAQAKLAIADSYFQEGSTGALTHAELEYKDFITFFPNAPEVDFAQHRAAMCNFRRLEKPDRDRTYAERAEREFQTLMLDYPDSDYAAEAEKKLLQVQEVLADSAFRVGRFYFVRGSWRAAASRLAELVERYPNYSRRDQAIWMLARSFENQTPYYWVPDPKRAAEYYAQLVRKHPMSKYVEDAKESLARLEHPIPQPDPEILARAQNIEPAVTEEDRPGLLGRMFGIFGGKPDTSAAAARLGPPPLHPPTQEPDIPPPPFSIQKRTVVTETVENLPEGAVLAQATGEPGQGEEGESGQNPPPPKKKSFWRKLVPFI